MGGSCCSRKSDTVNSIVRTSPSQSERDKKKAPISSAINLDKFKDMEQFDDIEAGNGIFRTKGYKCLLPYDKLVELRNDFWNELAKITSKYVVIALKQACCCDTSSNLINY